jgi:hypothetical protein
MVLVRESLASHNWNIAEMCQSDVVREKSSAVVQERFK